MPPKADYSYLDILPRGQLERRLDAAVDNYCALLESGADVDAEKKKKATQLIKEIEKRLEKKVKMEPTAETTVVTQNYQPFATDCAQFRALLDKVANFEPGREVAEFISDVENVYARIRIDIREETVVQHNFVSYVMGQMSTGYQQDLRSYETKNPNTVWTWSSFKEYLTQTYETSKTHFQILQALFKLEKKPGETNIDYSGRLEHYVNRVKTIVRARYQVKFGADHEETADQVFDLMGSMALLTKLEKDDNLMNFLSRDLDDCFSPREIAKHADRYLERRQLADPVLSTPTVNFARNYDQNCRMEKKYGQCTRQTCRYLHRRPRAPREPSRDHDVRHGEADTSGQGNNRQVYINYANQEPPETAPELDNGYEDHIYVEPEPNQ